MTQKQQRALFRKLALAALAVERHLDGEYVEDLPFEKLDSALAAIASTPFRKRFSTLATRTMDE